MLLSWREGNLSRDPLLYKHIDYNSFNVKQLSMPSSDN